MKIISKLNVDTIISVLQGTCLSLDEGIRQGLDDTAEEHDLTMENCEQIDNEIFNCATCGWWYEISELHIEADEQVCTNCVNE